MVIIICLHNALVITVVCIFKEEYATPTFPNSLLTELTGCFHSQTSQQWSGSYCQGHPRSQPFHIYLHHWLPAPHRQKHQQVRANMLPHSDLAGIYHQRLECFLFWFKCLNCVCAGPAACPILRLFVSVPRYWSRIDSLIREALILRNVRVRLLISCSEKTHPLTFNFVWSLRSLCMEQANCSLEAVSSGPICTIFISTDTLYQNSLHNCACVCTCVQKFFNPRGQRDVSLEGINHNRFMVTDRAIYLGELID